MVQKFSEPSYLILVTISKRQGIRDILNNRSSRKVFLILTFIFRAVSAVYYGLAYGAEKLPGSLYVNNLMNSAVECGGLLIMFCHVRFGNFFVTYKKASLA